MEWLGRSNEAIAILRVSSHRQKDNTSHAVQAKAVREYAEEYGLKLVRVTPIVESAKDAEDRTKYQSEIQCALKQKVRHILFYMTDRECRNFTDMERNQKLVKNDEIVLHYVKERKRLWKKSPQSDFMLRQFQALQDKQLSAIISEKVSDAMRRKAEDGWYPLNHLPLGYAHLKSRDDYGRERKRGTIIARDPIERNVRQVRREFELRTAGLTFQEIRDQVLSEGLVEPRRIKSYRANSVEKRIKNKFYFGYFDWDGIEYQGRHELIIPTSVLMKVKSTFGQRFSSRLRKQDDGMFSHWIRCGDPACGCKVIYDPKTKKIQGTGATKTFRYYHCTNGRRVHQRQINISEGTILIEIERKLEQMTITRQRAEEISRALNEANTRANATVRKQIGVYQSRIEETERQEDEAYQDHKRGLLDEEGFFRQRDRVRAERRRLTSLLEEAQIALNGAFRETAESILELAIDARSLWKTRSAQEQRWFLERVLSNPVLNGSTLELCFRKPFGTLAEMGSNGDWRARVDSNH